MDLTLVRFAASAARDGGEIIRGSGFIRVAAAATYSSPAEPTVDKRSPAAGPRNVTVARVK
jgi:hypothetical protein